MTRCYEFYCTFLQNPAFCEEKSDRIVDYINNYIRFMQGKGVKFDRSSEDKALFEDIVKQYGSEGAVTRERTPESLAKEAIDTNLSKSTNVRNEIQTENIPLITETPKSVETCSICEALPADVQKQVQECIERARLSPEEAEDLVTVVQQTPKEEILRVFLTPRAFIYQLHAKKPASKPEVREWKPQETAEHRQAVMHPQHSRMEEALLLKLHQKGFHPITDKEFCVQPTTPDFYFPDKNVAIYIDGEPHRTKENRDNQLRELLTKRYGVRVVSISYGDFTDEETERLFQQILETLA